MQVLKAVEAHAKASRFIDDLTILLLKRRRRRCKLPKGKYARITKDGERRELAGRLLDRSRQNACGTPRALPDIDNQQWFIPLRPKCRERLVQPRRRDQIPSESRPVRVIADAAAVLSGEHERVGRGPFVRTNSPASGYLRS